MPLSELYRLAKRRVDPNPDFEPGNDVFELVWENGHITTQGQSSRARKDPTCNSLPSHCLPSYTPKSRDKDSATTIATRPAKFGSLADSAMNEIPMSVPSAEVALTHDDDMIPWLNYPIDASLQTEYCPEFLPDLSGVTVHENSKTNSHVLRDSNAHSVDYCPTSEQRNAPKSQQFQTTFPSLRSRVVSDTNGGSEAHRAGFSSSKTPKLDALPPSASCNLINFSHFSRPAVLARASSTNLSMPIKDKACAASNASPPKLRKLMEGSRPLHELSARAKDPEAVSPEDASKNEANSNQIACESAIRCPPEGEKSAEPVVASSSVCSGNSAERASDVFKRKFRDAEDSECHSEDVEEESVGVKKSALPRASGSKRSRAAEVHNLSERRRRDRINEKMRALQELIPNCNKVDKASMLDEAIEYLKTLQLQVQIMSMGAGLCMPPMMLPAHFPPMGMGMGMGMGLGMGMGMGFGMGMGLPDINGTSSGYPMIQVPPLQGPHFPALHGLFGLPGQGMTMPMQRPPLLPVMGGPFIKPSVACGTGGSVENVEPAVARSAEAGGAVNQASSQTHEGFEHPALVQNNVQTSDANANASGSANVNDVGPSKAASYD